MGISCKITLQMQSGACLQCFVHSYITPTHNTKHINVNIKPDDVKLQHCTDINDILSLSLNDWGIGISIFCSLLMIWIIEIHRKENN